MEKPKNQYLIKYTIIRNNGEQITRQGKAYGETAIEAESTFRKTFAKRRKKPHVLIVSLFKPSKKILETFLE